MVLITIACCICTASIGDEDKIIFAKIDAMLFIVFDINNLTGSFGMSMRFNME